jgi:hypothetical protein
MIFSNILWVHLAWAQKEICVTKASHLYNMWKDDSKSSPLVHVRCFLRVLWSSIRLQPLWNCIQLKDIRSTGSIPINILAKPALAEYL